MHPQVYHIKLPAATLAMAYGLSSSRVGCSSVSGSMAMDSLIGGGGQGLFVLAVHKTSVLVMLQLTH
jgi:hypothetical protein